MKNSQLTDVIPGLVIFKISDVEFCINVQDVYVIRRLEETESLKKDYSNTIYYLPIHNINIPVIDISKYFNLSDKNGHEQQMILIIKHHGEKDSIEKTYGIMVDEVIEIINTEKSEDSYLHKFILSNDDPYLSGAMHWGDRRILLPNFSKITGELFNCENKVQ